MPWDHAVGSHGSSHSPLPCGLVSRGKGHPLSTDASKRRRLLIVDDEAALRGVLGEYFETKGFEVLGAASGEEALDVVGHTAPDVVLLDLRLPGISGLETLERIRQLAPGARVIVMTGYGTVDSAVTAMKLGAADFVNKPVKLADLLRLVEDACPHNRNLGVNWQALDGAGSLRELMGPSAAIGRVIELVRQVAPTNLTVILYGETGSGKSLVAKAIHALSARAGKRLVRVDCGAIPDTLIESELFGHERGAFTGAVGRNEGFFELAHRGTLFLDEVANLSEAMMRKILCALEERRIYRVGGKEPIDVDIRVVAASNQDLAELVERGEFRRDLFYRLNEFVIHIPPLRERKEDIPHLAQRFLQQAKAELGRGVEGFSGEAMDLLVGHEWPGNVRELRNVVKRATLMCSRTIKAADVRAAGTPARRPALPMLRPPDIAEIIKGQLSLKDISREAARQMEQFVIAAVLKQTGGNRSKAAKLLNVDYKTLYYKAKDLGK